MIVRVRVLAEWVPETLTSDLLLPVSTRYCNARDQWTTYPVRRPVPCCRLRQVPGVRRSPSCADLVSSEFEVLPQSYHSNLFEKKHCVTALNSLGRRGSQMVSALDTGSGGPGSSLGQGTALCFWARHFTLIVPLFTWVFKWVSTSLLLGVSLRWTSIPSRGGGDRNTPSRFMLQQPR